MGKFFACVLLLWGTSSLQAQQCVGNNCPLVNAITHPIQTVFGGCCVNQGSNQGCNNQANQVVSVRTENNCQRPRLFWRRCR